MVILFSVLPFVSTALGGLAALRLRHRLHPVMAFAAGVLVATALVDILPEAATLIGEQDGLPGAGGAALAGYLLFAALDALVHRQSWEHQHPPAQDPATPHEHAAEAPPRGVAGLAAAGGLIVHSTFDGLAIGLGFRADPELGLLVALAVLAHDFADGMNVVTLALAGGNGLRAARILLVLDALAPPFGALLSNLVAPSSAALGLLLAAFAGVFLAIGAGHLLPEAQHRRPGSAPTLILLAAAGAGVVVAVRGALG